MAEVGDGVRAAREEALRRYLLAAGAAALARPLVPRAEPLANVVGVGIGDKVANRALTGETSIKLYVRRKERLASLPPAERLPSTIDGIPTDVEEVGQIRALAACTEGRRQRLRPAPGGVSIGHGDVTAGTLGVLVRDTGRADNGRRYVLSNNHVLANHDAARPGDPLYQPGPADGGGGDADRLGHLARVVRLDLAGGLNRMDAALAEVPPEAVLAEICGIGRPVGLGTPTRDLAVLKHGRTTGLTRGLITDVDAAFRVEYGDRSGLFDGQVVIRGVPPTSPFSDGGDSGSLILDGGRRAVALLFAGASAADLTIASPLRAVLRRLRARLV